ncbi:MAG TPA: hypothetical protein PLJ88_02185 [Agitococcus sp.]|nr:hypothetical protein [Agitococcus sp.]
MDKPSNPFVFTKKTIFMQRISDAVASGSTRYIQGVIPVEKAGFFASKIYSRYDCQTSGVQALRKRKAGFATAKLYFWHPKRGDLNLHWILLVSDGKFAEGVGGDEKWRDPKVDKQRIAVTNYQLVRVVTEYDTKPRWTWRYTRASYDGFRLAIVNSIRVKNDEQLRQLIHSLWRSAGFAGVREQVKKIGELIREEWKRSRGSKEGMPELPKAHGYVRRLKDKGVTLRAIKIQLEKMAVFTLVADGDEDDEILYDD